MRDAHLDGLRGGKRDEKSDGLNGGHGLISLFRCFKAPDRLGILSLDELAAGVIDLAGARS